MAIVRPMDDLGAPSSYLALEPGTDVYSRDGARLGEVQHVLADIDADMFDGIVIDASALPGGLRFADASQVAEIYERGVVLSLATREAGSLPEPSDNPGSLEVHGAEDVDRSELREKLRRAWEQISGSGLDKN
jgi:sporulation protein YlmC with PRC-barrel domain